ncbi:MAG: YgjV family protein [Candidatus Saccharibacteria bacterium]|nr:YgjV family protein [Candidatus Saccharibacteria bacterium]
MSPVSIELAVSLAALVLMVASIMVKRRKLSIFIQGAGCVIQMICDVLINAIPAAIGELIDVIRSGLFIYKDKFSKNIYLLILIIFEAVIVGSCILTWEGVVTLLPMVGTMFRTYAAWQPHMSLIRIAGIVTGATYIPYYLLHGSEGTILAIGYGILLIVGIYEVIKHRDLHGGDGCSPDDKPRKKRH